MKKNSTAYFLILFCELALISGCSTAKTRVMPGENGTHRVTATDIERDDAEGAAVDAAKEFCQTQHKQAVFLKEDTKYTGSMNENTRNTIRKASQVASMIGFQTQTVTPGVLSGPNEIETIGTAGQTMTNDRDYKSEMLFKCQ